MSWEPGLFSTALPDHLRRLAAFSSALDYRLRLARRLTFSLPAQRESKQRESAPGIRPCISLRCIPGSFASSAFQGHAAKGHPWPSAAFVASMRLNPFHTDSALPSDGTFSPCMPKYAALELQGFGSRTIPVRRPSAGAAQQVSRQDAEKVPMGHGWPFGACLRSSAGAREVEHSETRMSGGVSFAYFSLHKQRKVRRPAGRKLQSRAEKSAASYSAPADRPPHSHTDRAVTL